MPRVDAEQRHRSPPVQKGSQRSQKGHRIVRREISQKGQGAGLGPNRMARSLPAAQVAAQHITKVAIEVVVRKIMKELTYEGRLFRWYLKIAIPFGVFFGIDY